MTDMIERVARQIRRAVSCWPECQQDDNARLCNCQLFAAQYAIAAMREPTEAMKLEGADYLPVTPGGATNECAGRVFEAMIDEALK